MSRIWSIRKSRAAPQASAAGSAGRGRRTAGPQTWRRLAVTRYPVVGLFERIWEIRANLSAYDASYVALAEALNCALVTADLRLSDTGQAQCPITVVPR